MSTYEQRSGASDPPRIHQAAMDGDVEALRQELEQGVSPNLADIRTGWLGRTPLHYLGMFYYGKSAETVAACFHLLVAAGADVTAADDIQGRTPLHSAVAMRDTSAAVTLTSLLIEAGADVNQADENDGRTPLHSATVAHYNVIDQPNNIEDCINILLRAGADVNARKRDDGRTPLEFALHWNFTRRRGEFPVLLRGGADLPTNTNNPYILRVKRAGGFRRYEQAHLTKLTTSFAPKFSRLLPPELTRRVVGYWLHAGYY